ncbi:uncharacterized protein LOC111275884 isoform X3 [Durio zibethinus]|uniref:Uncharacterized protein LOC111275884 isoform X3 n=1 Tax=Durio zibethinus TaxID=66656 RepID=A0A6P5WN45_DURZI|nr:uncharacterized protein LOC111275884 isoform X3 [Durio zibethinus]
MEDTTSEASSPFLTSQMACVTMYDQFNHSDAWNFRQHTNGVILHSQANQYQLIQGEPSEASDLPRARGCRAKLNESQKKEHKRQSDIKYRQNQKIKVNELTAENKRLQEENRQLSTENRHLKEENGQLSTENKHLKDENGSLKVDNRHLEECIRGLKSKGKLPAEDTQRLDSYISQSISQLDHQSVYVQDHHGVDSNNEEAVYMQEQDQRRMDSDIEGAVDGADGLEINDLRNLLLPENETNQNGRVAIHESASENAESSLSCMHHADMAMKKFLMKLDEEVLSNVDFSDFTGLDGEQTTVGRYSFPLSLIPTVERINDVCGDVSAKSLINPSAATTIYILFCATIKEMDDLQLEQVTEKKMLRWRDAIKDALRINFNVRFAMEHLKKVACAYFGLIGCILLQSIDARISQLEAEVNDWKTKRADICEGSKLCIAAAEEFIGVPVSTDKDADSQKEKTIVPQRLREDLPHSFGVLQLEKKKSLYSFFLFVIEFFFVLI